MNADGQLLFEIRDLCKSFGDIEVLKNINTTISQGEVVVIVGPSGSGKSTFLRSLNLLEEPTGGQISIFEERISRIRKPILTCTGSISAWYSSISIFFLTRRFCRT